MKNFFYHRKTGTSFALLFWILSIALFLLNIGSLAIIVHIPTVLAWSFKLLMLSVLLIFLCSGLLFLSKIAQWKSRLFLLLLIFSLSNSVIATFVFFKSKSIEEHSDQAKESLNKALDEINHQLIDSANTK